MLKNGPQNGLQKPIKSCSKTAQILDLFLCWFLWKMVPQNGSFFNINSSKTWFLEGSETDPEFVQIWTHFWMEFRPPQPIKILKKPLVFHCFFEIWPSCYRPHFGSTFGFWNPPFWKPKSSKNRPRTLPGAFPKVVQFFIICYVDYVDFWPPNGLQNQHKNA